MESAKKPSIEEIKKQIALNKLNINFCKEHLTFILKNEQESEINQSKNLQSTLSELSLQNWLLEAYLEYHYCNKIATVLLFHSGPHYIIRVAKEFYQLMHNGPYVWITEAAPPFEDIIQLMVEQTKSHKSNDDFKNDNINDNEDPLQIDENQHSKFD